MRTFQRTHRWRAAGKVPALSSLCHTQRCLSDTCDCACCIQGAAAHQPKRTAARSRAVVLDFLRSISHLLRSSPRFSKCEVNWSKVGKEVKLEIARPPPPQVLPGQALPPGIREQLNGPITLPSLYLQKAVKSFQVLPPPPLPTACPACLALTHALLCLNYAAQPECQQAFPAQQPQSAGCAVCLRVCQQDTGQGGGGGGGPGRHQPCPVQRSTLRSCQLLAPAGGLLGTKAGRLEAALTC